MRSRAAVLLILAGVCLALDACKPASGSRPTPAPTDADIRVLAPNRVEAGRYLVTIGACNDCHTPGYMEKDGNLPESDWLTGSPVGWRGPWGTTYPPNLRLTVQDLTEDAFVKMLHTRKALPPMPWMNVNKLSDEDARAIYAYLRWLGPKGTRMPAPVPPDQEPATPYLDLVPKHLERLQAPPATPGETPHE